MGILNQVKQLVEVGQPIIDAATKLEYRQANIEHLQRMLDLDIIDFHNELREQWTAVELNAAGIFIGGK
jgi:hypothetical protein